MTAEEYGPVVSHTDGQWDIQPAPTPRTPQQIAAIWGKNQIADPDDAHGEALYDDALYGIHTSGDDETEQWLIESWERTSPEKRAALLDDIAGETETPRAKRFFADLAAKTRATGDLPTPGASRTELHWRLATRADLIRRMARELAAAAIDAHIGGCGDFAHGFGDCPDSQCIKRRALLDEAREALR